MDDGINKRRRIFDLIELTEDDILEAIEEIMGRGLNFWKNCSISATTAVICLELK